MMRRGRVALVTGGARRVGRAIALALADAGYDIAVHFRSATAEVDQVVSTIRAAGVQAEAFRADFADPAAPQQLVDAVVRRFSRLDVLVNNASIFEPDPDGGFAPQHWSRTMQINTVAPANLIDAAQAHLEVAAPGCVINLCDISAERPGKQYQAYCASKAALVNLTKSYARRLAPKVLVNGISPGIAVFPADYDAARRERLIQQVPLRRAGTPEEIAQVARFLITKGSYITGQIIAVDGGRSIV